MTISCEIPSETMSMCVHGVPVKFECGRCEDNHRITLLESQIKSLTEKVNYLSKFQIGNLREDINCLLDLLCEPESIRVRPSNFKLKKELTLLSYDDVQDIYRCLNERYYSIYSGDPKKFKEKIEELEDFNERHIKCNQHINERIEKLEQLLKSVIETPNIVWAKYHKTPHKCPVCNGSKKTMFTFPGGAYWEEECKSCEGKGIVWG